MSVLLPKPDKGHNVHERKPFPIFLWEEKTLHKWQVFGVLPLSLAWCLCPDQPEMH